MCNLYSMTSDQDAIRKLFQVPHPFSGNLPASPAVFPGQDAPIILRDGEGTKQIVMSNWGFRLSQPGGAIKKVTNARDDKIARSHFWRESFLQRRCLVPATAFAEPKGRNPAIWHWFALSAGDTPRPLFAFAGIWQYWRGQIDAQPVQLRCFAIVTTRPNALVAPIHPHRMPVIIAPDKHDLWLHGGAEDAAGLTRPYPAQDMKIVRKGGKLDDPAIASDPAPAQLRLL